MWDVLDLISKAAKKWPRGSCQHGLSFGSVAKTCMEGS